MISGTNIEFDVVTDIAQMNIIILYGNGHRMNLAGWILIGRTV